VNEAARLLRIYDDQARTEAETPGQRAVTRCGPLRLVTFSGGRGFISYRNLAEVAAGQLPQLVGTALEHFRSDPQIVDVEWKARGHDHAPGLHEALVEAGFAAGEPESIMLGEAALLAVDVPLPPAVNLRQVRAEADVRAMSAMSDAVFGDEVSPRRADEILARLHRGDGMQLWVAEAEGRMIGAGRVEPLPNGDIAGLWGGSVVRQWRGRGIYRALTAARARAALAAGRSLLHSDSTEYSRPILEKAGLVKVSTTTPYTWQRRVRPDRGDGRPAAG